MISISNHDDALVQNVHQAIENAFASADAPAAVAKRIAALATRYRNRGREAAKRRHPFQGVCEASGLPLAVEHAHLDELEPERGYDGPVRWVCPRANNSGRFTCGGCG
ncbi:MAG: hypothetical protein J5I93_05730 [Pirellulaceae bacterium]|nr:hypothetical protein [Pirellulaceae bacterium]